MVLNVLLFSNSKNCIPCKSLKAYLATNHPDFQYTEVDVFEDMDKAMEYKVKSAPTMILLKDDVVVDTVVGYNNNTKEHIEKIIFSVMKR